MIRVLDTLDIAGNEIKDIKIENVSALPSNRQSGCIVFLNTDNYFYFFNGQTWEKKGSPLKIASNEDLGGVKVGGNIVIDPETGIITSNNVILVTSPQEFPDVGDTHNVYVSLTDENMYIWNNTLGEYRIISGGLTLLAPTTEVTTLSQGQPATVEVEMTGTPSTKQLNFKFGIPKGDTPNVRFTLEENGDLYVEY